MNKKETWQVVASTGLSLLIAVLIAFNTGCSRTPTQSSKQNRVKVGDDQPKFSEISSEPSDTAQVLALAEAAYAAKDWEAAEKHYVSTTRAIPKEATPWFRLGNIYARTDRPDFAVRAYKEALLRDPEMSKAWYNMGLVQLRQSANSFLQMRTYTQENSEAQIRADTMYEATIALIKDGPQRAKAYPYSPGGTIDAPTVDPLSVTQSVEEINGAIVNAQPESSTEEQQDQTTDALPDGPLIDEEDKELADTAENSAEQQSEDVVEAIEQISGSEDEALETAQ